MNQTIAAVRNLGQSFWVDFLHREMIHSGRLSVLIDEGISGVTSNPTAFAKAMTTSSIYADQIQELKSKKVSPEEAYEVIVVQDIQEAADLLRPAYDQTDGLDGYVSLEISPLLAYDTRRTIEEAWRIFKLVDRPNLMVKIPGTPEGIPAVEELIAQGVNVNVTLLFSIDLYAAAARAYLSGIKRLVASAPAKVGKVASVASFFLSRFDVLVDQKLEELVEGDDQGLAGKAGGLLGQTGVAAGKLAYQRFEEIFRGEEFVDLQKLGVKVQRPLWASTRTKNSVYSDIMYVQPLLGPNTVNTMAQETIEAFKDHGEVKETVGEGIEKAVGVFNELENLGIVGKEVTDALLKEGVQKFTDSFTKNLDFLKEKLA